MSLRDNGQGASYIPDNPSAGVKITEPKPKKPPEVKLTEKFLAGLDTLTFDPVPIATVFALAPTPIQIRLMDIFRLWIDVLEQEYNNDRHRNNDHYNLQVTAKRLNEGMLPYEE